MKSFLSFVLLTVTIALARSSESIQRLTLDDWVVVTVPVATNRVTTISLPGPIAALDAVGVTADGKTPGQFQIAHTKGSSFLSVRALMRKAATNLNLRWNKRTYVFELVESDTPVLALHLEERPAMPSTVYPAPLVSPTRLLALLDKAKAFPLLKAQQPEAVAGAEARTFGDRPPVTDFNDYEIRIEEIFRFNVEDTLVFHVTLRNKSDQPIRYLPESFNVRVGNRLYHQSISDAPGILPARTASTVYFAITGTPDGGRRERLCRLYNDTFNHTRIRTFNGDHLTLPGASGAIELHGHQKAGVWRILQTPNTLLAHVVGAGKTFTMVAAAMELKRLGLARKPMFSVPNHMLGQFSTELLTLYPGANILVAGKEDFESQHRKKLFSRIATGNWDAVIVTHSGFERIPLARETQERFFEEQLHELEMIKRQHADSSNRRLVKEIEKAKKRLEAKLQALAAEHKKDNTLTFEELGVDRIFVDEAHYFKNLFYVTKMTRIAGLPQTASERAFDMYLKVRHVQSLNGGGGVVFATGTPIANSMAEVFTMQRYLQPEALKQHNLHHFDSWAATFGEPVTAMELSPDGAGYRLNTRFARFINVPELMQMFRQSADVQTAAMLNLPRPKLEGEKPTIRNAPATEELKEFVQSLATRAEKLKCGRMDPSVDNMLKITSEGRKAALDLRLMKPAVPDEPEGKVNQAVENIHRIWQATGAQRSTQLVFCDLSTPKDKGFSVYRDMAEKLKGMGIPDREIAFIQDFDSDASKLALFRDVRAGKIRVLFGSTQKMGSGTNVQERLIALHHLDAPWRPADVEQREGRILRQGNKNSTVQIFRYVTEGSFDAYMWQTLETKAKFIAQVMSGDMTIRRLEDLDSAALTYAEVKAIASGNPLVIEKAQVDAELMRLTRLRSAHAEEQFRIRSNLRRSQEDAEMFTSRLTNLRQDLAVRQDTTGDKFIIELDGQETNHRGMAGELILRRAEKLKSRFGDDVRLGRFAGFDLYLRPSFNNTAEVVIRGKNSYAARVTDTALGTIRSLEATVQGFEERAIRLETDIADARKRTKELETKVGAAFEKEGHFQQLRQRQSEIEEQLDLTKNQAPSQVETEATNAVTTAEERLQSRALRAGRSRAVQI